MAITPAKPDFYDGTWRGKIRVWAAPTIGAVATGDILDVPGIKRVFKVVVGSRPTISWTTTAKSNGVVTISLVVSASCTGGNTPLYIYGQ